MYQKSSNNCTISQGDLTEEADSNLYVNPLEAAEKCGNRVKKSTSGEVGRNVTDVSPSVESLKDVRPFNESGKVTLNDTVPKHRKIRIQQVCSSFVVPFLRSPSSCSPLHACLSNNAVERRETALTIRRF